ADFQSLRLKLTVTTDDGSLGERGFVTTPLERLLAAGEGVGATIYACGPWIMMKRVAEIASRFDCECIVSLEAPMGCGFGVCVGCVVAVGQEGPAGDDLYNGERAGGAGFGARHVCWEVKGTADRNTQANTSTADPRPSLHTP